MFPRAINFHLLAQCNARCLYCFATFRETPKRLSTTEAIKVMRLVREAGGEKMNFVGGEPTLHRDIGQLILTAKQLGFTTSVVSNGKLLESLLHSPAGRALDWVGLSIDSATDAGNVAVGRAQEGEGYVAQQVALARKARELGAQVKLNTVVTRQNVDEDMTALVSAICPQRWKVFQALRVEGQNEQSISELLIDESAFQHFVERHRALDQEGIPMIPESNNAMTDSYAMIDPLGRFFGNSGGKHQVGLPILKVGAASALASVDFRNDKLVARGGEYEWQKPLRRLSVI